MQVIGEFMRVHTAQVENLLLQGGTVGVFPEGFTHDGPNVCVLLLCNHSLQCIHMSERVFKLDA
jgi:hypothetical protein